MKKFKEIFQNFFKPELDWWDFRELWSACENGNLDTIDNLLTNKKIKNFSISPKELFKLACTKGHLDIVRYLLTSPKASSFHNLHIENTDLIEEVCDHGQVDIVKYLFTSPELQEHPSIQTYGNIALRAATRSNQPHLIRFLISSPEFKEHINIHAYDDLLFQRMCLVKNESFLEYLIYDLNIEKTDDIKKFIKNVQDKDSRERMEGFFELRIDVELVERIGKIMDVRDLEQQLKNSENKPKARKMKI